MSEEPSTPAGSRGSLPVGARCARHPEHEASATCTRCGDFTCSACARQAQPAEVGSRGACAAGPATAAVMAGLCPACSERLGPLARFRFTRDSYTFGGLFQLAIEVWRPRWGTLALATWLFFTVVYAPALLLDSVVASPDDPREWAGLSGEALLSLGLSQLFTFVLDTAATLVMSGYVLDLLERSPGGLRTRFARLRALPAQIAALLLVYAGIALVAGVGYVVFQVSGSWDALPYSALITGGFALVMVPLLAYVSLGVVFVTFELAHSPGLSPWAALRASWELVEGKRVSVALIITLSTLLTLLGLPSCLIGVLFTFPIGMLCSGALYLALKQR